MSIFYRADHERRLVVVAGYGTLTDDEVFGFEHEIAVQKDAIAYDELIDMTHVTRVALPSPHRVSDLATTAAGSDALRGHTKLAIVAPSDLAYGLGRMFQTRRSLDERNTREIGVFRTMAEAIAFLGLEREPAIPAPA